LNNRFVLQLQPSLPLLATTLGMGDCRVEWTIRTFNVNEMTANHHSILWGPIHWYLHPAALKRPKTPVGVTYPKIRLTSVSSALA